MNRCRWNVPHFIVWEEPAQMQGMVGHAVVDYPAAHLANYGHVVVQTRNDEVRQFYPHASVVHGEDGVKDGLQMSAAVALVNVVAE